MLWQELTFGVTTEAFGFASQAQAKTVTEQCNEYILNCVQLLPPAPLETPHDPPHHTTGVKIYLVKLSIHFESVTFLLRLMATSRKM